VSNADITEKSPPFFILTGPPGAGKSTLLRALDGRTGTVYEPARRVLAEARRTGNGATGTDNPAKFVSQMLDLAVADYLKAGGPTIFDRALPDLLAYCAYYQLPDQAVRPAIDLHVYRSPVFYIPAWEEIYVTDEERTLDFAGAKAFGQRVEAAYRSCDYDLVEVPFGDPRSRADFISRNINA
jgi:predicted ATPase